MIYKTDLYYKWHIVAILFIIGFSSIGAIMDKSLVGFVVIWIVFFIVVFLSFYYNKCIIFYPDRIVLERFFISHAREEIMHSSIKQVNYEDALQVRFDNEKLRIVYREGRREVKKILPLNLISEETLYEVIESFKQSRVRTIVKSKKKVFQNKDKV